MAVAAAAAPGFAVFGAAIAVVGVSSVVAQVIVPMSSSLSAEHERGQVVGTVMSGLLIGILLARTVSGLIAAAFGWRTVFWFAAVAMVALAATLRRALPRIPPTTELSYGGLLRSVLALIRRGAGAAPADADRRPGLRLLQHAVDVAGLPAVGRSVPLRQRGDRPVRARRRRRRGRRVARRTPRRPRPRRPCHHGHAGDHARQLGDPGARQELDRRPDRRHRRSSTSASRGCTSPTRARSTRCARRRAAV